MDMELTRFSGIDPLPVCLNDRVRVRMGNLSMTNHPIHVHGRHFSVTGTDGGWVPESAQWPESTIDVPVGAIRAAEFIADNPGDWALHCHKTHHTMNSMGHDVRTYIGADIKKAAEKLNKLAPGYMPMGTNGMGMMGEMKMSGPDNTLPMMTGDGQFGPIEMGGMFTVIKIRAGLAANDYKDPGPYDHPGGTIAYEFKDKAGEAARQNGQTETKMPSMEMPGMEMQADEPGNKGGHRSHH